MTLEIQTLMFTIMKRTMQEFKAIESEVIEVLTKTPSIYSVSQALVFNLQRIEDEALLRKCFIIVHKIVNSQKTVLVRGYHEIVYTYKPFHPYLCKSCGFIQVEEMVVAFIQNEHTPSVILEIIANHEGYKHIDFYHNGKTFKVSKLAEKKLSKK